MAAKQSKAEFVISAVDKSTRTIRNINKSVEEMNRPVSRLRNSFRALFAQMGFRKLGRSIGAVRNSIGNLTAATGALLGKLALVSAAAGGAFFGLQRTADGLDGVIKTAEQRGVGAEWLQEMQYAAKQAGVETNTFDMALQRFQRRAAEAAAGSGEAQGALRYLGIELKDINGKMRPTDELFREVADGIARIEDPALRTRVAFKLFDSEGVKLVSMLKDGSKGLDDAATRARALGFVMSEDALRGAEEFGDTMDDMGSVIKGVWYRIAVQLMPAVKGITNDIIDWYLANQEMIKTDVADFARRAAQGIREFAKWVKEMLPMLGSLLERIGGLKGIAIALAVIFGASLVGSMAQAVLAVIMLAKTFVGLGIAMMTTPIGWLIAGITAVAGAVYLIYKNWDGIVEWFGNVFTAIGTAVQKFLGGVVQLLAKMNPFTLLLDGLNTLVKALTGFDLAAMIGEKVRAMTGILPDWLSDKLGLSFDAGSAPATVSTVAPRQDMGRQDIGGLLRIQIDSEGRASVKEMRSDHPGVDLTVDSGLAFAP